MTPATPADLRRLDDEAFVPADLRSQGGSAVPAIVAGTRTGRFSAAEPNLSPAPRDVPAHERMEELSERPAPRRFAVLLHRGHRHGGHRREGAAGDPAHRHRPVHRPVPALAERGPDIVTYDTIWLSYAPAGVWSSGAIISPEKPEPRINRDDPREVGRVEGPFIHLDVLSAVLGTDTAALREAASAVGEDIHDGTRRDWLAAELNLLADRLDIARRAAR